MRSILSICLWLSLSLLPTNTLNNNNDTYVYICTGKAAYSYHKSKNCSGLNRCKATIIKVTLEKAKSEKRTACKICYRSSWKFFPWWQQFGKRSCLIIYSTSLVQLNVLMSRCNGKIGEMRQRFRGLSEMHEGIYWIAPLVLLVARGLVIESASPRYCFGEGSLEQRWGLGISVQLKESASTFEAFSSLFPNSILLTNVEKYTEFELTYKNYYLNEIVGLVDESWAHRHFDGFVCGVDL